MKVFVTVITTLFFVANLNAGIDIRYYNKDSKSYEFDVKTCGSKTTVEFGSSRTASVTIQSGCSDAIIYTDCGEVKIKDNSKITIKDGCIIIE